MRPVRGQIDDLIDEIRERVARHERVLVTTLTKRMAEDLTDHLLDAGIRVNYMNSDTATMDRVEILRSLRQGKIDVLVGINLLREGLDLPEVSLVAILDARVEILRSLRQGKIDVLVGINLLREGLDLPEVSLVAILDADKEGFLRNRRSLIQTIGRAARNAEGEVIMYADSSTCPKSRLWRSLMRIKRVFCAIGARSSRRLAVPPAMLRARSSCTRTR